MKMQYVTNYRKNNCQRYLEEIKINSKWALYNKKVMNKQIKIYEKISKNNITTKKFKIMRISHREKIIIRKKI
jgi:hypothetical protein